MKRSSDLLRLGLKGLRRELDEMIRDGCGANRRMFCANFGRNDPVRSARLFAYSGNGEHQFNGGAKGLNAQSNSPINDADIDGIDLAKMLLRQKAVVRRYPTGQRLAQFFRRSLLPSPMTALCTTRPVPDLTTADQKPGNQASRESGHYGPKD